MTLAQGADTRPRSIYAENDGQLFAGLNRSSLEAQL